MSQRSKKIKEESVGPKLSVLFGKTKVVHGQDVEHKHAEHNFHVDWSGLDDRLYTVIVKNVTTGITHLYRINEAKGGGGQDVVLPTLVDEPGIHLVELYEQAGRVSPTSHTLRGSEKIDQVQFKLLERGSDRYVKKSVAEEYKKYYSCVVQTAMLQSPECLKGKRWRDVLDGEVCYDPYSVCGRNLEVPPDHRGNHYIYENMTDRELIAIGLVKDIEVAGGGQPHGKLTTKSRKDLLSRLNKK